MALHSAVTNRLDSSVSKDPFEFHLNPLASFEELQLSFHYLSRTAKFSYGKIDPYYQICTNFDCNDLSAKTRQVIRNKSSFLLTCLDSHRFSLSYPADWRTSAPGFLQT